MWGALLTRKEEQLKKLLEKKLTQSMDNAMTERDSKILEIQNSTIRKIQKLNIEYKYNKATDNMLRDWWEIQAKSMLWALRLVWLLS